MGQRELKRWHLMEMAEVGKITLKEATEKIGVSYRQAKRIRRAIRDRGAKGLVHGNRGRPSNHRLKDSVREKVLKLSKEVYWDFNDTHFTEKLRECEGIDLNRETVILKAAPSDIVHGLELFEGLSGRRGLNRLLPQEGTRARLVADAVYLTPSLS